MNISLGSLKGLNVIQVLSKGTDSVLWFLFIGILAANIFVLKHSLDSILSLNEASPAAVKVTGVRVNFDAYHEVEKRIDDAKSFVPEQVIIKDPFTIQAPPPVTPAP